MCDPPKIEFALGSEVSPGHFFKSSFARSFVNSGSPSCGRGDAIAKSLNYDFYDNGTIVEEEPSDSPVALMNGNFYSLVNFGAETERPSSGVWSGGQAISSAKAESPPPPLPLSSAPYPSPPATTRTPSELAELEKLRKQCQALTEENERLQQQQQLATAVSSPQPATADHVQVIDNVYLQNQVDTLQWQLKQCEANRQMYRSLMEQVVRFLDRSRKSLDIISEKSPKKPSAGNASCVKDKCRVPRSRSVHAVHAEHNDSPSRCTIGSSYCASSTTSSASSSSSCSSSSRFARAKSVAQLPSSNCASSSGKASGANGFRDLTWSVLRRNEPAHCAPPRAKQPSGSISVQDIVKTQDSLAYKRPELDPDEVPPEKLSMEAFRLMRTIQSLLVMREPDLARLMGTQDAIGTSSPSPPADHPRHHRNHHHRHHLHRQSDLSSLSLQSNFANSTALSPETPPPPASGCSSDRGTEGSSGSCSPDEETNRTLYDTDKSLANGAAQQSGGATATGARQSLDDAASNSSKNTEDAGSNFEGSAKLDGQQQLQLNGYYSVTPACSTPHNRRMKKADRKELHLKSLRDWALGNSSGSVTSRPKPATSVSSAEDESGFSSMSSFQEVGLPHVNPLSPIKAGCHAEIGLPEVPIEKVRHRRWSSTPAEFNALFKRHSGTFASSGQTPTESLSVWV